MGLGIIFGSMWAYEELGWGGWWFWDPVENAALIPWLTATALLHSVLVSAKNGAFQGWTILLGLLTFSLSLIGTFLVRSGLLTSVHSFANDSIRGILLLVFITVIIGSALLLYARNIPNFIKKPNFSLFSRETLLLMNSVVLLCLVATILLGTLFPILADGLQGKQLSVGEPYFNTVMLPIILPLLFIMGISPHTQWKKSSFNHVFKKLYFIFGCSVFASLLFIYLNAFSFHVLTLIGLTLGCWIIFSTFRYILLKSGHALFTYKNIAMIISHLGLGIMILSITINKSYSVDRQMAISPGQSLTLFHQYQLTFLTTKIMNTPHYEKRVFNFLINKNQQTSNVSSEQRIYSSHGQVSGLPGIFSSLFSDVYITIGPKLSTDHWLIRVYYEPCIRWIWSGGILLLFGGLWSLRQSYKRFEPSS